MLRGSPDTLLQTYTKFSLKFLNIKYSNIIPLTRMENFLIMMKNISIDISNLVTSLYRLSAN